MRRIQISFLLCLAVSFAFSLFAQDTKELILLQTSDVHSRIEPVNQKGDRNYNEGGFVPGLLSLNSSAKSTTMYCCSIAGIFRRGLPIIICFRGKWKLS